MVKSISVVALDIDGVLTDGATAIAASRDELKRISFRDLDAVHEAKRRGLEVVLITGEDSSAVDRIAARFDLEHVIRGAKDKLKGLEKAALQLRVSPDEICYVGDSDRDAPALRAAGLGLAPADASAAARAASQRVLTAGGGRGAAAEAIALVIQLHLDRVRRNSLETGIRAILTDSLNAHQELLYESPAILTEVALTLMRAIREGRKILLFGNGGSAAEAQHVAGELVGRFARESEPWAAIALSTDTSILTAVGNDWDFSEIFARQVRALARPGDVVVGLSTSGRSPNVLRGLEAGRARGAVTIGFTGASGGKMGDHCDILFRIPSESTPRIQELSLLGWHCVCELVEQELVASVATRANGVR